MAAGTIPNHRGAILMAKRSDRAGYWSHIMLGQAASGLSIKAFCAKRFPEG